MKIMKMAVCHFAFIAVYSFMVAVVMQLAEFFGCASDSGVIKIIWFLCGYMFSGYLKELVIPFLNEKFP